MTALALVLASLVAAESPPVPSVPAELEASFLQLRRRAYIVGGVFSGAGLAFRALAIAAAHPREFEPKKDGHVFLLAGIPPGSPPPSVGRAEHGALRGRPGGLRSLLSPRSATTPGAGPSAMLGRHQTSETPLRRFLAARSAA